MDIEHLVGAGVGVGLITAFWSHVKMALARAASLFVVQVSVDRDLADAIAILCWSKMSRSPFGARSYSSQHEYVRSLKRYQNVAYETIGSDPILFWRGWRPLLLGKAEGDKPSGGNNSNQVSTNKVTLTFLRFFFNTDALLNEATNLLNERVHSGVRAKRFCVYAATGSINSGEGRFDVQTSCPQTGRSGFALGDRRLLRWDVNDLGFVSPSSGKLASLALQDDAATLVEEVKRWKKSQSWYEERGVPWRFGWLLHGKPGTGKTATVRAIGQELDLPVWSYDLATMSNRGIKWIWSEMKTMTPCIALIEDIDTIFHGRNNVVRTDFDGGLTFDCLLNCIDGVESAEGIFLIITTNDLSKIDPALGQPGEDGFSTRPGRVDRILELVELDEDARWKIAHRILDGLTQQERKGIVAAGKGDTGAKFCYRCSSIALEAFWTKEAESKDERTPDFHFSGDVAPLDMQSEGLPVGAVQDVPPPEWKGGQDGD